VTYHGPGQLVLYPLLALRPVPMPLSPHSALNGAAERSDALLRLNGLNSSPAAPSPYRADLHWLLRSLESIVIRLLRLYGIEGHRIDGASGVWVESMGQSSERTASAAPGTLAASQTATDTHGVDPRRLKKIAAVGLACSSWVSMHGIAINIDCDLRPFDFIVPCGLSNEQYGGVTSLMRAIAERQSSDHQSASSVSSRIDSSLLRRQLLRCFEEEFGVAVQETTTQPPRWPEETSS